MGRLVSIGLWVSSVVCFGLGILAVLDEQRGPFTVAGFAGGIFFAALAAILDHLVDIRSHLLGIKEHPVLDPRSMDEIERDRNHRS